MSTENTNINIQNNYSKYNLIRTKLLLFIDQEIRSKIKQNNRMLKFNCDDEIRLSFEETFSQKESNKYNFSPLIIHKKNENYILDKSLSKIGSSSNKINEKSYQKERGSIYSKTLINYPNQLISNIIYFNKKFHSIKNISKRSNSILILHKQKNAAEYLKNLCNDLKITKNIKKPVIHTRSISINNKFLNLNRDKKASRKSNKIKTLKSKKDVLYNFSLFKKPQKKNFGINPKHRKNGKSTNSILIIN